MVTKEISALLMLLDDESPDVVAAVRERLLALGEDALAAVRDAAQSDDARRRLAARATERAILAKRCERALADYLAQDEIDLETAVIMLAKVNDPFIDGDAIRGRLDELGKRVRELLPQASTPSERAALLGQVIHGQEGITGDEQDYYHPANSYIDLVLDRRKGIPITLAVIYVLVGQRAGLNVFGIGFPRHFVAGFIDGAFSVQIDAYHGGKLLDRQACADMLFAQNLPYHESFFARATPKDILRRMLGNLAFVYRDRNDSPRLARSEALLSKLDRRLARKV